GRSSDLVASPSGGGTRGGGRGCASRPRRTRPARSRTFRCFEIAGWLMANGCASSATDASPEASRARIARRVGSASAANVASRPRWFITIWLYIKCAARRQPPPDPSLDRSPTLALRAVLGGYGAAVRPPPGGSP